MPGKRSQSSMMTTVQDFYERYPYPRPIDDLEKYRRLWQDGERRRADFHLFWPTRRYREDFSILIAGCGTGHFTIPFFDLGVCHNLPPRSDMKSRFVSAFISRDVRKSRGSSSKPAF
jgi:hypothetical protein